MEPVPPAAAVQSQPLGSQGGPMKTFLIVTSCGVLLASVLLNILQCTGQPLTAKNYQNVIGVKVEKI